MARSRRHKKMLKKIKNLENQMWWKDCDIRKLKEANGELTEEVDRLNKQIINMRAKFNVEKILLLRGRR